MKIKGRAETPKEKRAIVERVLRAWEQAPTLRLGQFIDNALTTTAGADTFNVEDDAFASRCEFYVDACVEARAVRDSGRTQPDGKGD